MEDVIPYLVVFALGFGVGYGLRTCLAGVTDDKDIKILINSASLIKAPSRHWN
jgi:hypothetical protein